MTQANIEMAQFDRASLHNTIMKEVYVRWVDRTVRVYLAWNDGCAFKSFNSPFRPLLPYRLQLNRIPSFISLRCLLYSESYVSGATLFEGVKDIEGSDWTDTYLRKDQQKYLCNHPTAKGTNPVTGVDTRESLMCRD